MNTENVKFLQKDEGCRGRDWDPHTLNFLQWPHVKETLLLNMMVAVLWLCMTLFRNHFQWIYTSPVIPMVLFPANIMGYLRFLLITMTYSICLFKANKPVWRFLAFLCMAHNCVIDMFDGTVARKGPKTEFGPKMDAFLDVFGSVGYLCIARMCYSEYKKIWDIIFLVQISKIYKQFPFHWWFHFSPVHTHLWLSIIVVTIKECYGERIKALHYFNKIWFGNMILSLLTNDQNYDGNGILTIFWIQEIFAGLFGSTSYTGKQGD